MSRFDRYAQGGGERGGSRFDRFVEGARSDTGGSVSRLQAFGSGAGDAISFGFGDELQGLLFGPEAEAAARSRQERARAEHPLSYTGGQLAGGMVGGGVAGAGARMALRGVPAVASLASNMGPMSRIGAAALTGAVGGGTYAAGDANGGEANVLGGALAGGLTGGAAQGVFGELAPRIGGAIARGASPDARASHMMGGMMQRFGQSPDDLRTALQNAPDNAILGDVIGGGPSVIQGAGARPSAGRDALREFYDTRNNEMATRGASMIDRHLLGGAGEDTAAALTRLESVQAQQAAPLYARVHQGVVQNVPRPLQDFIAFNDRAGARFRPALEATRETMRRTMGANATDEAMQRSPLFWHRLLENVQAEVGASIRGAQMTPLAAPRGSAIADMTGDAATFNRQVRHLLGDEFRRAQDIYAGSARAQDAIELGYEAVSPNLNSLKLAQLQRRMRRMSQGERDHFRLAAANRLKDLIFSADTGTGRADVLRQLSRNTGQRRVLEQIFGQGGLGNLMREIEQQRGLVQNSVQAGIGVNSHTAPLLLAHQSQQALTNPTQGGIKDAVLRLITGDMADQYDERVSNQILTTMQMRPADALAELNATGRVGRQGGLLSAAARQAQRGRAERPRRAVDALAGGLYAPIGGNALAGYAGGY